MLVNNWRNIVGFSTFQNNWKKKTSYAIFKHFIPLNESSSALSQIPWLVPQWLHIFGWQIHLVMGSHCPTWLRKHTSEPHLNMCFACLYSHCFLSMRLFSCTDAITMERENTDATKQTCECAHMRVNTNKTLTVYTDKHTLPYLGCFHTWSVWSILIEPWSPK